MVDELLFLPSFVSWNVILGHDPGDVISGRDPIWGDEDRGPVICTCFGDLDGVVLCFRTPGSRSTLGHRDHSVWTLDWVYWWSTDVVGVWDLFGATTRLISSTPRTRVRSRHDQNRRCQRPHWVVTQSESSVYNTWVVKIRKPVESLDVDDFSIT